VHEAQRHHGEPLRLQVPVTCVDARVVVENRMRHAGISIDFVRCSRSTQYCNSRAASPVVGSAQTWSDHDLGLMSSAVESVANARRQIGKDHSGGDFIRRAKLIWRNMSVIPPSAIALVTAKCCEGSKRLSLTHVHYTHLLFVAQ